MTRSIPARVAERAFTRWVADGNGCHISTYSCGSHGYAQVGWWEDGKGYGTTAHRAAWTHVRGEPPPEHDVDHQPSCDKRCVNVEHLRELTRSDNRRRGNRRWPLGQCVNGHSDSERVKCGKRIVCRMCVNDQQRAKRARQKAVRV